MPVAMPIDHAAGAGAVRSVTKKRTIGQQIVAFLLNPRSIHMMLMLGGGLMVIGMVIWLVNQGILKEPLHKAIAMTVGSLIIHLLGCTILSKTRFKIAGKALTFWVACCCLSIFGFITHKG